MFHPQAAMDGVGKPIHLADGSDTTDLVDETATDGSADDGDSDDASPPAETPQHYWPEELESSRDGAVADDGLVYIEPEEGIRRGHELLAMLWDKSSSSEQRDESVPLLPPPPPPASRADARPKLSSDANMFVPKYGCSSAPVAGSYENNVAREPLEIVKEAARYAFGADLEEVSGDADIGLVVEVCNAAGHWDAWTVQATLSTVLSHFFLGKEIMTIEPGMTQSVIGCATMQLHCVKAGAPVGGQCWEKNLGDCPRGARCRWRHDRQVVKLEVLC